MEYIFHLIIIINIYIIITTSTNLLVGMTNLLSIGQAALYGLGAYFSVFALMYLKLTLIPSLLLTIILTGVVSYLISLPAIRLKGDYFILSTLGFQIIVFSGLYNLVEITRGPYGIPGIPSPSFLGIFEISGIYSYLILSSILATITVCIFYKLLHSPYGRTLKAVRDDEIATETLGRSVTNIKVSAFILSGMFISIGGFLYATYVSYIDPTSFSLDESIFILSAVIIGGTGNIKGPIVGAIFVVLLPEALRFLGLPDSIAANMRQIIYGLALILLMRFRPQGLLGEYAIK